MFLLTGIVACRMTFVALAPLCAVVLIFTTISLYSAPVAAAAQKGHSANFKKPVQFQYVCPMHDNVTSKKPGICPKCKMKLVRKPLPQQ